MNLAELLLGAGDPVGPALLGARGSTSYASLSDLSARLGSSLIAAGIEPGDRVCICSANDEAFVVAYLAVLHVGGVAVPLNPLAPPLELEREMGSVDPKMTLAAGPSVSVLGAAAAKRVVRIDLDGLPEASAARVSRDESDVAVLLFTSGTAGAPKATMLTHGNLAANIRQVLDHPGLRLEASDVSLAALPFFHVFGLNAVLGLSLAAGASLVLVDHFDPETAAQRVTSSSVTVVAGVPAMYAGWLATDLDDATFRSVRLAVSGAAALPEEIATGFTDRYEIDVHQGYGLTEASPIVTTTALMPGTPKPGSIGPPLPGVSVRLVDDDGEEVLAGDPGEIWVQGPNVFPGYWKDAAASERALTPDGWLRTGDIAVVDDDGQLRLVDRAKDLIIVSGFNVFPVEVEDVLRTHDDVRDAAVAGEPNPRTGEAVVAYVVPKQGRTPDEASLSAHCAHSLARYKCPSRVEIVDHLPRAPSGKLLRRELGS